MSDKNTAITETGLGRMLDQFKGSEKLRALAAAFLDQVQAFEDAAHPILAERGIDNATGDRLDGLGAIFNVPRGGRDDTTYRKAIKAELLILQSTGTAEEILTIAQALIEMPVADYDFFELYPKTIYLRPVNFMYQYPALVDISQEAVGTALRRATSAATEVLFVYSFQPDQHTFTLGDVTEVETDQGNWDYVSFAPGDEWINTNSEVLASITTLRLGKNNNTPASRDAAILALGIGDYVRMYSAPGEYVQFIISGTITDGGTYRIIPVSSVTATSGFAWPADTTSVNVQFVTATSGTDTTRGLSDTAQTSGGRLSGTA